MSQYHFCLCHIILYTLILIILTTTTTTTTTTIIIITFMYCKSNIITNYFVFITIHITRNTSITLFP